MANGTHDANAICPFYLFSERKKNNRDAIIACEGRIKGTHIIVVFKSYETMLAWLATCCETYNYAGTCPYAALLEAKYVEAPR